MTIRLSRDERDRSSISSVCCDNISRLNSDRGWLLAPLWRFKPNEISAISMLDKIQSSHAERSTIPLSANGFCPLHFGQSPISSRFFPRLFLLITPLSFFFSLSIFSRARNEIRCESYHSRALAVLYQVARNPPREFNPERGCRYADRPARGSKGYRSTYLLLIHPLCGQSCLHALSGFQKCLPLRQLARVVRESAGHIGAANHHDRAQQLKQRSRPLIISPFDLSNPAACPRRARELTCFPARSIPQRGTRRTRHFLQLERRRRQE